MQSNPVRRARESREWPRVPVQSIRLASRFCAIAAISFPPHLFDAAGEPVGFIGESAGAVGPLERAVAFEHIEADIPLQFPQADGTEMQRPAIALGQMIRAVHQAVEVRTMREAKHVAGLMCEHFAAPPPQQSLVTRPARFAEKCRIVAGKAVNADTIAE